MSGPYLSWLEQKFMSHFLSHFSRTSPDFCPWIAIEYSAEKIHWLVIDFIEQEVTNINYLWCKLYVSHSKLSYTGHSYDTASNNGWFKITNCNLRKPTQRFSFLSLGFQRFKIFQDYDHEWRNRFGPGPNKSFVLFQIL